MKKFAKIILAVLLVAALVGTLAFVVSADDEASSATPFNPADEKWAGAYTNIAYGAWISEDAFNLGDAPKYWFQNKDKSVSGTNGGYATHIYAVDKTVAYYQ